MQAGREEKMQQREEGRAEQAGSWLATGGERGWVLSWSRRGLMEREGECCLAVAATGVHAHDSLLSARRILVEEGALDALKSICSLPELGRSEDADKVRPGASFHHHAAVVVNPRSSLFARGNAQEGSSSLLQR